MDNRGGLPYRDSCSVGFNLERGKKMGYILLYAGAALAVVPFVFTQTVNGAALLGVVVMLAGAWRIAKA